MTNKNVQKLRTTTYQAHQLYPWVFDKHFTLARGYCCCDFCRNFRKAELLELKEAYKQLSLSERADVMLTLTYACATEGVKEYRTGGKARRKSCGR